MTEAQNRFACSITLFAESLRSQDRLTEAIPKLEARNTEQSPKSRNLTKPQRHAESVKYV